MAAQDEGRVVQQGLDGGQLLGRQARGHQSGLLAKAVRRTARIVARVKATGAATRTRCPDHSRAAGRRVRQIASKLRLRGAQAKEEAQRVVRQATAALATLADTTADEAQAVLRNARRALIQATGRRTGRLRRAVNELAAVIEVTTTMTAQARSRLAGVTTTPRPR